MAEVHAHNPSSTAVPPPLRHPALDDNNFVARDLLCIRCNYNLRSRAASDACPECGSPVQRTLTEQPLHLHYADPHWLMLARVGALLLGVVSLVGLVPVACYWLGFGFAKFGIDHWPVLSSITVWPRMKIHLLAIALCAPNAIFVFLLTRKEPAAVQPRLTRIARPLARWLWIASLFFTIWWLGSLVMWNLTNMPSHDVQMQAITVRQFGKLVAWFAGASMSAYLYSLLRRTDEPMSPLVIFLPPALSLINELLDVVGIVRNIALLNQLPLSVLGRLIFIWIAFSFARRLQRAAACPPASPA